MITSGRCRCGHAGGESIDVEMKLEAALDTRDALAKSIYAAIFKCVTHCHLRWHGAALFVVATRSEHSALSMAYCKHAPLIILTWSDRADPKCYTGLGCSSLSYTRPGR